VGFVPERRFVLNSSSNRKGIVVALSGVDCAGKSTQRDSLMQALRSWGYAPTAIWTRAGYTPALKGVKRAWQRLRGKPARRGVSAGVSEKPSGYPRRAANLRNPLVRWLWLTSALLELLWVYGVRIRLWRAAGRVVVCDRYLLDCLVDFRVNFPTDRVEERWLCRLLRRISVRPDASFCMLIPAEQTMMRARGKSRFHWETLEVLRERRREYEGVSHELAVQVLDGARSAGELALTVQRSVLTALRGTELRLGRSH